MSRPDKIYLIHYTKLIERLEKIKPILDHTGVPYEIITQYDKEELLESIPSNVYEENPSEFSKKIRDLWNPYQHLPRRLNLAEISCTAKHIVAIEKLSKECQNYGLILEDDAQFFANFSENFQKYMAGTPQDWDAIFLGEGCGTWFQIERINGGVRHSENCFSVGHPASNCTEAYLLKPDIARKIAGSAKPFHLVSDWEMAYQFYKFNANVFWWYPALVTQGSKNGCYKSELEMGQRE